jgi:alpha-D-xyloside xylohydrolase
MMMVLPGIWKVKLGRPEKATPLAYREAPPARRGIKALPAVADCPLDVSAWSFSGSPAGCRLEIPVQDGEQFFGLGLQLKSHAQRGKKKVLRVNSDPVSDTGDSHAPVPFLVSTRGYGLYFDTLRYASVYVASHVKRGTAADGASARENRIATNTDDLYGRHGKGASTLVIQAPAARGLSVFVFGGPTLRAAVQRYNLFSGGGCLPAMWGLGVWYRTLGAFTQQDTLALARSFRERGIPCDVLGLEPGWQTHTYSCTYAWNRERFPDPDAMTRELERMHYRLNLWEHVFVHPDSPLHVALRPHSADYEVWGGLVPDLTVKEAREAFAAYHERELAGKGVTGFKLDECDNSDFISFPWSFPEHVRFPSGLDGEQMHSLLGLLYQRMILSVYRKLNRRTCCQVRSSHALAAPYPFVLYSDLYDHRDFVRGVVNQGFSGLLWSPEVRHAVSPEDLVRRLQSVALSPQALINAWYIRNPPWLQVETEKNNRNEFMPSHEELEAACRDILRLRMRLLPYLYAAFARYWQEGLPPFRALAMDWPEDVAAHKVDDAYLMGDSLLVAPMFAGQTERKVYLPAGEWFDFHTRRPLAGGQTHTVAADLQTVPMFVRGGSIVPLAEPVAAVAADTVFRLTAVRFGQPCAPFRLFEDDGETYAHERGAFNTVELAWDEAGGERVTRRGKFKGRRYEVVGWEHVE